MWLRMTTRSNKMAAAVIGLSVACGTGGGVALATDNLACGLTELSDSAGVLVGGVPLALSADGYRALFLAKGRTADTEPYLQLFLFDTRSGQSQQVTNALAADLFDTSISVSDDLQRVVFRSNLDLAGRNPAGVNQVFLLYTNTGVYRQLTLGTREFALAAFPPVISGDGRTVALVSRENPLNHNDDGSPDIFLYTVDSGGLRQVTNLGLTSVVHRPVLSRDGRYLAVRVAAPLRGTDSLYLYELKPTEDGLAEAMLLGTAGRMSDPILSGDGGSLFFVSNFDPFGTNPTGADQVFGLLPHSDSPGESLRQLTFFEGLTVLDGLASSGDGSVIVFRSNADLGQFQSGGSANYFSLNTSTGSIRQLTYLLSGSPSGPVLINGDGTQFLLALSVDPVAGTPGGNREAYLARCVPAATYYFPQVGDGVAGTTRIQTNFVFTNTGEDTSIQLEFFNQAGQPMAVSLKERGVSSFFSFAIQRGTPLILQTAGSGALSVGYARVSTGEGITGTAVFTGGRAQPSTTFYEAAVPLTTVLKDFTVVVNTLGDFQTGLAMVNPDPEGTGETAVVVMRLYDQDFRLLGTREIHLAPGQQMSQFADSLFADTPGVGEMVGNLTVSSSVPLAVITLRLKDSPSREFPLEVPTLTTLPVSPGRPDQDR